ncbi:uncharacterized protein BKA78DRAFT_326916 [Phyllosticta capitalensis]|uniref:uncharacterized protein n=1 Tax=Phyllosticta capitalensis TaxID=121624 RepID=UPI003130FB6D
MVYLGSLDVSVSLVFRMYLCGWLWMSTCFGVLIPFCSPVPSPSVVVLRLSLSRALVFSLPILLCSPLSSPHACRRDRCLSRPAFFRFCSSPPPTV